MRPLTQDTIEATRLHFAESMVREIEDVLDGRQRVENPGSYINWVQQRMVDMLDGKCDHTFTFRQRAHWLQTGDMQALLP